MSLVMIEGFTFTGGASANANMAGFYAGKWDVATSLRRISSGRTGTSVQADNSGALMLKKILTASEKDDVLVVGYALQGSTAGSGITLWGDNGVTAHLTVAFAGGQLAAYRGTAAGTLLGTTTGLSFATWHYVEVKAKLHDSAGYVEIWVDEVNALTLTGVDTRNGGTDANFDAVSFQCGSGSSSFFLDDIYILNEQGSVNNDRLGVCYVTSISPTGAGSSTQWTPSTGSNWDCVNDPTSTTHASDYVTAAADDLLDLYTVSDVTLAATEQIKGVLFDAYAQKSDIGAREIAIACKSGGTTDVGADQALEPLSYRHRFGLWETDPATGALWTQSGLNGAEFGYKSRS